MHKICMKINFLKKYFDLQKFCQKKFFDYEKCLTKYFSLPKQIFNENLFLLIVILFISMISQIGDLVISYFKRKAKLKDTGKIIPGHGGLLDRIDGMIFVFPIFYLISIL